MLTYLAGMRPELRYGNLVLCQAFRNPALLAKMTATFQHLSQGNFLLGIGTGWMEEEARAYHLPFAKAGQRVSELEEQLQIINALWREEKVTFEGQYHQVTNASCFPHPEPIPPILIPGFQPRMMRLVARYADWWNTVANTPEEAIAQSKALDAACEQVGRDPKTLRRTAQVSCFCAPSEQQVQELIANFVKTVPSEQEMKEVAPNIKNAPTGMKFAGTPAQIVEQFQPVIEAGFDYLMIVTGTSLGDFTALELLSHEVLPALNKGHERGDSDEQGSDE